MNPWRPPHICPMLKERMEIHVAAPQEKAWQDGYAVGKKGKPEKLNPYKKGMLLAAWQEGWRNGAKAHEGANA